MQIPLQFGSDLNESIHANWYIRPNPESRINVLFGQLSNRGLKVELDMVFVQSR